MFFVYAQVGRGERRLGGRYFVHNFVSSHDNTASIACGRFLIMLQNIIPRCRPSPRPPRAICFGAASLVRTKFYCAYTHSRHSRAHIILFFSMRYKIALYLKNALTSPRPPRAICCQTARKNFYLNKRIRYAISYCQSKTWFRRELSAKNCLCCYLCRKVSIDKP